MCKMSLIEKYREVLNDHETSDAKVMERLKYMEAVCRNIISMELQKYVAPRDGGGRNRSPRSKGS